ncbi:hypothetical protein D9M71_445890 [compost metagenome]
MEQEARHVGEADRSHLVARLLVTRADPARRYIDDHDSRSTGFYQATFQREGDRSQGRVTTHRQATGRLDEQQTEVSLGTGRRVKDGARHVRVPARLEHQRAANPVVLRHEVLSTLAHGCPLQDGGAFDHHAHGHAFGVAFDTGENLAGHVCSLQSRHRLARSQCR